MRKSTTMTLLVLFVMIAISAVLYYGPTFGKTAMVNELAKKFMADVQFKDFRQASLYHHKLERDRVDIGKTIEKLFLLKPEMIDIREFRIVKSEIDENRARVLMNVKFQRLNIKKEPEEGDIVLYFMKRNPDCPIGGRCQNGVCMDEFGKKTRRPEEKDKKKKKNVKPEEKFYSCIEGVSDQWFMNLDSTLKEKKYNY